MAKNDFDFEFDYEDDYDLEPRADMGSDDTDEFDLSQFGIDMSDLSPEDEETYDDFDFGGLDLGEDAPAEDEELDLSGLDLGIGSDSDPDDPEEPDEEDFDLTPPDPDPEDPDEEDFDLTPPDAGEEDPDDLDDLDDLDFDDEEPDEDPDEDLTEGMDFGHRASFFQTGDPEPVEPVAPVEMENAEEETPEPMEQEEQELEPTRPARRSRRRNSDEEKPAREPIKLTVPPVLTRLVRLYFPTQEEIRAASEAQDGNGRRRRKPTRQRIFKDFYLPTIIAGLALVLMVSFAIGSLSNAIDRKREENKQAEILAQKESEEAALLASEAENLLSRAEALAQGYDYDAAITLLESYAGEPTQEMTARKAEYLETKSHLVEHKDPSIIPNLSFHVLIHDMAKAMQDDDDLAGQYNRNFVSTGEFTKILEQLYKNGYVLVDYDSIVTNNNGSYFPNTVYLPEGKKPVMLTETMVNYFEYMVDGNKDGTPDADGDGFANKLVLDASGEIKAEWVDSTGATHVGDYDLVPILETFIKAHPDFSYKGARATLAVTGSEGIFGYRINTSVISTKGTEYYDQQVLGATKIVEALKAKGYNIACYTFNNENYFDKSAAQVKADLQLWNAQIAPVVGQLDTIVFARASDLGDYTGGKFDVVFDNGFRIFVKNADEPYAEVNTTYVRQSRLMVTGNALAWKADKFATMFDANVVLDLTSRGGSVPN